MMVHNLASLNPKQCAVWSTKQCITVIDYANNRYKFDSMLRNTGAPNGQIGYSSIQLVQLEREQDDLRYMPVCAGISIDITNFSHTHLFTLFCCHWLCIIVSTTCIHKCSFFGSCYCLICSIF